MTHKLLLASTLLSLLLIGCGQAAPDLDNLNSNANASINNSGVLSEETVNIDESNYGKDSKAVDASTDTSSGKNSSADGFKSIYFAFGDYGLSSGMAYNMQNNYRIGVASSSKIKIEGNCDEFGTDEYNYALGLKRAKVVKDALVSQGISANNIVLVTLGESSPVCTNASSECYKRNRRVDLRLVR